MNTLGVIRVWNAPGDFVCDYQETSLASSARLVASRPRESGRRHSPAIPKNLLRRRVASEGRW